MIGRSRFAPGLGLDATPQTQAVRLMDVLLLGPFMIWAGMQAGALPGWARAGLAVSGAATIAYNGTRYFTHAAPP